jgi:hypothetical protein
MQHFYLIIQKPTAPLEEVDFITNENEYFLFIDLHKEENIDERINYKDKFLDRQYFQWQSPNSTSQGSERGKNIIFNKDREVNLHIFVRKYKQIDGIVQPYIYPIATIANTPIFFKAGDKHCYAPG